MVKGRTELEKYLYAKIRKLNNSDVREYCTLLYEKYNIPIDITADYLTLRTSGEELLEFVLFAVLEILLTKNGEKQLNKNNIEEFFTENEIKEFSKTKYSSPKKVKLPIRFSNIVKIADDQYIGKITVKELMLFRASQMIDYNENSQRAMKKLIKGNEITYQIMLNKSAVREIVSLYEINNYIPNTITLNMPEDSDFYYNEDSHELIVKDINHFDILDGYHRYIAMSQKYDIDNNFDYNMEIRLVQFPISKAKQFIFQEDQKTKMSAIDSKSYNQHNAGNIIAERLNGDTMCDISGLIGRNNGIIPFSEFSLIVNSLWFKGRIGQAEEKQRIREVIYKINTIFNILSVYDSKLLTEKYDNKKILGVLYTCYVSDTTNAIENYNKINKALLNFKNDIFNNGSLRRVVLNCISNALKGDDLNV